MGFHWIELPYYTGMSGNTRVIVLMSLAVGVAALLNLLTGAFSPQRLLAGDELAWQVVWQLRLPRMLQAAAVGGLLAWAGVVMQSLFRNPLADPGLIGVSAGAAAAAVLALALFGAQGTTQMVAAFIGGVAVLMLLYRLATRHGVTDLAWMLLAGIALNAVASALIGLSLYLASDEALRLMTRWLLGAFGGVSPAEAGGLMGVLGGVALATPLLIRALDGFLLGEADAWQMGIDTQWAKRSLIVLTALAVGVAVATSGVIGFVGLVAPHVARLWVGALHRHLVPVSVLLGMALTLLADALARVLIAPAELPVGLLLSALGGPFFLWLLLRMRRV